MRLEETPEQQALRKELREYFTDLLTDDVRAQLGGAGEGGPMYRQMVRRMGADGWLGIGWPQAYGGQGRPATDQFIFFDEVQRAGAPFPFVTINTVGPTIMAFGSEEQKQFFLPAIVSGELVFAIGYTEPEAGTDLASLRTRAERDGDEYLINGSKIFTSQANDSDYIWLACRTNPDAPKHKGISIIAVPTSAPGFSWTIIRTVGRTTTCATYYDNIRVPVGARIGPENEGWRMITTQLNHERVGLAAMGGPAYRLWDEVLAWSRSTPAGDGSDRRMVDLPWVQTDLARSHARLAAMRLLNWRMAGSLEAGEITAADSSAVKVYGTECLIDVFRTLLGVLGPVGYLRAGSPGAVLHGQIELMARSAQINTFGGGVNDVQREIIAAAGLGMARRARDAQ
jgi:3-oxocholest-4-en-26-oyl-CoA dehydrogenase alpha subunit